MKIETASNYSDVVQMEVNLSLNEIVHLRNEIKGIYPDGPMPYTKELVGLLDDFLVKNRIKGLT